MSAIAIKTSARFAYENKFRREMLKHLTPAETKVMVYIMDKTLGWMKDRERISMYEIEDGKGNNGGTGITRKTVIKCVHGLAKKGIIFIHDTCKRLGTLMVLNLEWVEEAMLKQPKQDKKASSKLGSSVEITLQKSKDYTTGSGEITLPINKRNKTTNKLNSGTSSTVENLQPVSKSISEAIEDGKAKNSSAVEKKRKANAKKASDGFVSASMLEDSFVDGMRNSGLSSFTKSWTRKEQGQINKLSKSLKMSAKRKLDFMYFVGENWKHIIRTHFSWTTGDLANTPSVGFLVKYANDFLSAYSNKDKIKRAEDKSSVDGRIARMVAAGHTEESAREELNELRERSQSRRAGRRTRRSVKAPDPIQSYTKKVSGIAQQEKPKEERRTFIPDDMEIKPLDLPEMGEWEEGK